MTLSTIAYLLIYIGAFGILFVLLCLTELLILHYGVYRRQRKRDKYFDKLSNYRGVMRDITSPPRLGKMASYRDCAADPWANAKPFNPDMPAP